MNVRSERTEQTVYNAAPLFTLCLRSARPSRTADSPSAATSTATCLALGPCPVISGCPLHFRARSHVTSNFNPLVFSAQLVYKGIDIARVERGLALLAVVSHNPAHDHNSKHRSVIRFDIVEHRLSGRFTYGASTRASPSNPTLWRRQKVSALKRA